MKIFSILSASHKTYILFLHAGIVSGSCFNTNFLVPSMYCSMKENQSKLSSWKKNIFLSSLSKL